MKTIRVLRARDQSTVADPCFVADTFVSRLVGLMGRERLEEGTGLWLEPCNSIHTFFMRFAIDAVYLDGGKKILSVRRAMKPWRFDFPVSNATTVLELPAGGAANLTVGELLCTS